MLISEAFSSEIKTVLEVASTGLWTFSVSQQLSTPSRGVKSPLGMQAAPPSNSALHHKSYSDILPMNRLRPLWSL